MAFNPYSLAGTLDPSIVAQQASRQARGLGEAATEKQKRKMTKEFEAEIEKAQKEAQEKAGKNKGLFQGLNILGMLLGPLGAGLTAGISGLLQSEQGREAAEKLLGADIQKYEKTFLGKGAKEYKKAAESQQKSLGESLTKALMAGATGFGLSKLTGGEKGGILKDVFKKPPTTLGATKSFGAKGAKLDFGYRPELLGGAPTKMGIKVPDLLSMDLSKPLVSSVGVKAPTDLLIKPDLSGLAAQTYKPDVKITEETPAHDLVESQEQVRARPFQQLGQNLGERIGIQEGQWQPIEALGQRIEDQEKLQAGLGFMGQMEPQIQSLLEELIGEQGQPETYETYNPYTYTRGGGTY